MVLPVLAPRVRPNLRASFSIILVREYTESIWPASGCSKCSINIDCYPRDCCLLLELSSGPLKFNLFFFLFFLETALIALKVLAWKNLFP